MQKRRYRKYWKWLDKERARVVKRIRAQFENLFIYPCLAGKFEFLDTAIEMAKQEQDKAARAARDKEMQVYTLGIWNEAPVLGIPLPEPDHKSRFIHTEDGLFMEWHPDDYKFWLAAPAPGETLQQFHERLNNKNDESVNPA